jgi:Tfp pilus assembly protein PilN
MSEFLQLGVLAYLLILWGLVTTVFIVLLIRRSLLTNREDDQLFLDAAEAHMAAEQRMLINQISSLSRPLLTTGITSGILLLVIAGMWLYEGLKSSNFF